MKVLDVALVVSHRTFENVSPGDRPVAEKTHIGRNVWLGGLDRETERAIMTACEPYGLATAPRLHQPLYSFYRAVETDSPYDSKGWDPGGCIERAVVFSRLARVTSAGFDYAARIIDGARREVVPIVIEPGKTWLVDMPALEARTFRNWLTVEDAALTAKLVQASFATDLPRRVWDALFFFESAHYIRTTNVRWPVLATASEALLKVWNAASAGSTKIFVERMRVLSERVGYPVDADDLAACYEERSRLVHGGMFEAVPLLNGPEVDGVDPQGFTAERRHLYVLHEEVLRKTLVKCILEPEFAQMFADDNSVTKNFPIPETRRTDFDRQARMLQAVGLMQRDAKALLEHFGTPAAVVNASMEALTEAVGPATAEKVFAFVRAEAVRGAGAA